MIDHLRYRLARWLWPGIDRPRPEPRGLPMHLFFTLGWHNELNRKVAEPEGVKVGFWLNDDPLPRGGVDDGLLVHGWECIPIERASILPQPTEEELLERRARWRAHIAEVRGSADTVD